MKYSLTMKNLFIPTTKKTRNATIDTNILRTGDCFFVSGLQRAKNKHENNCIDVATRYLENLRTTVRTRTTPYRFHAIYTRRIECRIVRREELKIGLPDREIAHGFGSLTIYEQRFSVFTAG